MFANTKEWYSLFLIICNLCIGGQIDKIRTFPSGEMRMLVNVITSRQTEHIHDTLSVHALRIFEKCRLACKKCGTVVSCQVELNVHGSIT